PGAASLPGSELLFAAQATPPPPDAFDESREASAGSVLERTPPRDPRDPRDPFGARGGRAGDIHASPGTSGVDGGERVRAVGAGDAPSWMSPRGSSAQAGVPSEHPSEQAARQRQGGNSADSARAHTTIDPRGERGGSQPKNAWGDAGDSRAAAVPPWAVGAGEGWDGVRGFTRDGPGSHFSSDFEDDFWGSESRATSEWGLDPETAVSGRASDMRKAGKGAPREERWADPRPDERANGSKHAEPTNGSKHAETTNGSKNAAPLPGDATEKLREERWDGQRPPALGAYALR
ncbi:hypothetical protein T484DRAFT_1839402, partial [Baffinella frigidus]